MKRLGLLATLLVISLPADAAKPPTVAQCAPTLVANEKYNEAFAFASDRFNRGEIDHPRELIIRKAAMKERRAAILASLPRLPDGLTPGVIRGIVEQASQICEHLYGNKLHHLWLVP